MFLALKAMFMMGFLAHQIGSEGIRPIVGHHK